MKIGFLSTFYAMPTPPVTYGGMERINSYICNELVKRGHDVTLFGMKGSILQGGTVVEFPGGGEIEPAEGGAYPPFFDLMIDYITTHEPFDLFHDSSHHHEFTRRMPALCSVSTVHNPNPPESHNSIFLSNFHRQYLGQPSSPYVMNGLPVGELEYSFEKEDYMLFMGGFGLHKGFDRAIRASVDYQIPLKLAGWPMGETEKNILEQALTYPWIEHLGTIGGKEKNDVLKKAKAVICSFKWPEPGSLFVIEAMACGTPVIASTAGVLSEYIQNGVNGIIGCSTPEEINEAWNSIECIDPERCLETFFDRYTIERVVDSYLEIYGRAVSGERW